MIKKIFLFTLLAFAFTLSPFQTKAGLPAAQAQTPSPTLDSGGFMFSLTPIVNENIEGTVKQSWIRKGINYFFERIIGFMAAIIGTLCVLVLSFGGFLMLASAGNETRYEDGKNYVIYGLIGLAITLSAYILVTLVQLLINNLYG